MLGRNSSFRFPALLGSTLAVALSIGCGDSPPVTPADGGMREDAGPPMCPAGTELCGTQCVNTDESRAHCGACGNACAVGEACVAGACDVVCPSSQTECDGACIDTASDRRHCGACDAACAAGEACVDGGCALACPEGQVACGAVCVDTESDPAHCGACDAACEAGAVCSAGECATTCGTGLTQCDASCVDVQNDPAHCGACDAACPGGATGASGLCVSGACRVACNALEGDCNADLGLGTTGDGCETPLATDPMNCGACARVCTLPHAVTGCAAGACTLATCDAGFDDCDGIASNGCETDLRYDNLSCGACGTVCPTGDTCVAGACMTTAGETCNDALTLAIGANTLAWTAASSDFLTSSPQCSSTALTGPDLVLRYTATAAEFATIAISKTAGQRWTATASIGACGFEAPEAACFSDASLATLSESFFLDAGETVYVYLSDTTVGANPLDNPLTVDVTAITPPCTPGAGGIVGDTVATAPTGLASFTEYYVVPDTSPTGYVFVGGLTDLYRIPKAGGTAQNIETLAGLTTDQLGYAMVIDGSNIFLVESSTAGTTEHLWRISTDGGATWSVQDYASFPSVPTDDFRSATVHDGRIYLVTEEDTAGVTTQIWSVDAAATTLPAVARLELSVSGEGDCAGIARDSTHYYLACDDGGDRIVRVPVAGGPPVLITSAIAVSATVNSLVGDDTNADGAFDVLYFHSDTGEHSFVCSPGGAAPFAAPLAYLGGDTLSYGMGFDSVNRVLWSFEDDTHELVSVR